MSDAFSNAQAPRSWRLLLWVINGSLLVLPWVAMQFTNEVNWTAYDFTAAAMLLIGAGAASELTIRITRNGKPRMIIGGFVLATVLLIWAEGAVGIFH